VRRVWSCCSSPSKSIHGGVKHRLCGCDARRKLICSSRSKGRKRLISGSVRSVGAVLSQAAEPHKAKARTTRSRGEHSCLSEALKEGLSGPRSHNVGPGRSTTPLSTRWIRLGLSGWLWTPTTDRAALAPGSLSFLAVPSMGCSHRMRRLPTLAGNLALLFAAHRSEATASTFCCLHVFLLFLSTEDLGFDSHISRKGFSSPTRIPPSRRILQLVSQHHRLVGHAVITRRQTGQEREEMHRLFKSSGSWK